MFSYIYHWAKLSYLVHSQKVSYLYHGFVFAIFGRRADFADKLILILWAFWPVCWLSRTSSKIWLYPQKKCGDDSHSWLKRYMASTCILSIVIYKFIYGQGLCLVVLFLVDKSIKISLHYAILSLVLVIYLWIEYSEKLCLISKK